MLDTASTSLAADEPVRAEAAARTAVAATEIRKVRAYERDRTDR